MKPLSPRPAGPTVPSAVRLTPGDLAGLASIGLRTRKLRAGLSALGIAIGVAAIVAVLGLAASAQAALLNEIEGLVAKSNARVIQRRRSTTTLERLFLEATKNEKGITKAE